MIMCDFVVVGGGLSGVCSAITAARAGLRVTLIQDRPVLGGNASSEIRLWALGATAHMGNNNRWAREDGVIGELLIENMYRNPEGNPLIFDTILLEKVIQEPNIRLLLNSAVYQVGKYDADTIRDVTAFCSQNSTQYHVQASLFCDASGDGILGFLSGAAFRMGAESYDEFAEKLAPNEDYGQLLGHSIYFYSKNVGHPVTFIPPSFALDDITQIPRWRNFNTNEYGCQLWWIEYGGRLDTVHDTEKIKWELWKVVYGVWHHIKNSGNFPDAENLTLEWVGTIPGKRESRRFEGDYILNQHDVIRQRHHADAVSFGGWALDLHPADGIYSEKPGCNQWHSRGLYQIPYRCLYSRNIHNLFLAGRIISVSHVAFGSTRVMLTSAHAAQAVGMAAVLCKRDGVLPSAVAITDLQRNLLRMGHFIPHIRLNDPDNLIQKAHISASSHLSLTQLPASGASIPLTYSRAQLLPIADNQRVPAMTIWVDVAEPTTLTIEHRASTNPDNHTPDLILDTQTIRLTAGDNQKIVITGGQRVDSARYVFVCLMKNEAVRVHLSDQRLTGVLSVANTINPKVSNFGKQEPQEDIGIETFEFWVPARRPNGQNFAFELDEALSVFDVTNITNGWSRPTHAPNAWVADFDDTQPTITIQWDSVQSIGQIDLLFDTDFDHPMESVLMTHPERVMPFCVRSYRIRDAQGNIIAVCDDNHQTRNVIRFDSPIQTDCITIDNLTTWGDAPPAIFDVRCYSS
ncbi:MAG: FAD-dependent oxidoreductase [bacterium]|nr:FAD-dependent oxidoreductase [bacterium]